MKLKQWNYFKIRTQHFHISVKISLSVFVEAGRLALSDTAQSPMQSSIVDDENPNEAFSVEYSSLVFKNWKLFRKNTLFHHVRTSL